MKILHCDGWSNEKRLELETQLLRTATDNYVILSQGTTPAIILGRSCDPTQLIDQEALEKTSIPVIRRSSGGGTVLVGPDTLFISFILNKTALPVQAFPQEIMEWSCAFLQKAHPHLNMDLSAQDYTINNCKFGGNAQSILKNRILHHSSLLWDYDPILMQLLTIPKRAPTYRNERPHQDFLCCLKNHFSSKTQWEQELINAIQSSFK